MDLKEQQSQQWIKDQMADHITALEREIDRQDAVIKLLTQALYLTLVEVKNG